MESPTSLAAQMEPSSFNFHEMSYWDMLMHNIPMLVMASLLALVLLLLLWPLIAHSRRASRTPQTCRLGHYITLTKYVGMIGFAGGVMFTAHGIMVVGFKIVLTGGGLMSMLWVAVALKLMSLVLGGAILLSAYVESAIFQRTIVRDYERSEAQGQ